MKVVAVIPARYASTRLPGKPLADIGGKPMIQRVYEQVIQARGLASVWVATDDDRIVAAVRSFGGNVMLTAPELPSGTDRVAAVADDVVADAYVNVQGDEPLIDPISIEKAVHGLMHGGFAMTTLMTPIRDSQELQSLSVVKVVADSQGRALYFSRYPIPYSRGEVPADGGRFACQRHLGLYVYRRETLFRLRDLSPSSLEMGEMLEQLRALENGIDIGVAEVASAGIGVDTPEDLERVRRLFV